ncbi:MAG: low affinity iron permease family protein [Candidatus Omnitrophica bacterium]|nr:low affinity iron permease family protein [Candidatus Omnitrophota bacterium]
MMEYLSLIAKWISEKASQSSMSFVAFLVVLVWVIVGLPLHFSVTWQSLISTLSSVISIFMLFIIQNSQNRHTIAIQLKLDEIIRATKGAHNEMMDIEKLTDEDLATIQKKYGVLAEQTKEDLKQGKRDTHTPDITNVIEEDKELKLFT